MSEEKKNEILDQDKAQSDEELADVTGGKWCLCGIGGGGEANMPGEKTCACVLGGGGEYNSEGEAKWGEKCRCVCVIAGSGTDMNGKRNSLDEEEKKSVSVLF